MGKLFLKAHNKKEKRYQWAVAIMGLFMAFAILYYRNFEHPEMTGPQFAHWMWGVNNRWILLVGYIVFMLFCWYKGQETTIKKSIKRRR